jgi:hypothetical protein
MTVTLKQLLGAALALAALCPPAGAVTARREANGAIRYYDDNGNDRGYAWCMRRSGRSYSGWSDCRYFSYEQCRAEVPPFGGDCEPNAFSYYVQPPPAATTRRR